MQHRLEAGDRIKAFQYTFDPFINKRAFEFQIMIYRFIYSVVRLIYRETDLRHRAYKKQMTNERLSVAVRTNAAHGMSEFIKYSISRSQNKTAEIINFIELRDFQIRLRARIDISLSRVWLVKAIH